jgi:hypothetical protein
MNAALRILKVYLSPVMIVNETREKREEVELHGREAEQKKDSNMPITAPRKTVGLHILVLSTNVKYLPTLSMALTIYMLTFPLHTGTKENTTT